MDIENIFHVIRKNFDSKKGYGDNEITIDSRYLIVPEEDQSDIINGYVELYKEYFGHENLVDFSNDEAKILAGLIHGDVWCRKSTFEQVEIYKNNGAELFMYHFDIEMPVDWFIKAW
mgnify:CR=1 FL=1